MKLEWHSELDEHDNEYLEAPSPYQDDGGTFSWRLRQRLENNRIEWYDDSDTELGGRDTGAFWLTQQEAMKAIQDVHDVVALLEL